MTQSALQITDKLGVTHTVAKTVATMPDKGTVRIAYAIKGAIDVAIDGARANVARLMVDPTTGIVLRRMIHPDFRRRGISTAMNRLIEADIGKPPLPYLLEGAPPDIKEFWRSWLADRGG